MTGSDITVTAVLTVVSVLSFSALTFLCLRCRKKSKIIHEENRLYDQQTFQREGSRFAVMRSKTVTKPNQITRQLPTAPGDAPAVEPVQNSPVTHNEEEQPNYANVSRRAQRGSTMEAMYVNPLAESDVYQNVDVITETAHSQNEEDNNQYDYENIFPPSLPVSEDGDDYENSDFLEQVANQQKEEEDYPDYENAETQPDNT